MGHNQYNSRQLIKEISDKVRLDVKRIILQS